MIQILLWFFSHITCIILKKSVFVVSSGLGMSLEEGNEALSKDLLRVMVCGRPTALFEDVEKNFMQVGEDLHRIAKEFGV